MKQIYCLKAQDLEGEALEQLGLGVVSSFLVGAVPDALSDPETLLAEADQYRKMAKDPPDPNFTLPAVLLIPPVAGPATSAPLDVALTALAGNHAQAFGLARAMLQAVERAQGAGVAGNAQFQSLQAQAAGRYAAQLASVMAQRPGLQSTVQATWTQAGLPLLPLPPDQFRFIQVQGLAPPQVQKLLLLGVAPQDVVAIQERLWQVNPLVVSARGPYPLSLNTPRPRGWTWSWPFCSAPSRSSKARRRTCRRRCPPCHRHHHRRHRRHHRRRRSTCSLLD
jgi:hypothetical protein